VLHYYIDTLCGSSLFMSVDLPARGWSAWSAAFVCCNMLEFHWFHLLLICCTTWGHRHKLPLELRWLIWCKYIVGVSGQSPQRGPGVDLLIRGVGFALWSWKHCLSEMQMRLKFVHFCFISCMNSCSNVLFKDYCCISVWGHFVGRYTLTTKSAEGSKSFEKSGWGLSLAAH